MTQEITRRWHLTNPDFDDNPEAAKTNEELYSDIESEKIRQLKINDLHFDLESPACEKTLELEIQKDPRSDEHSLEFQNALIQRLKGVVEDPEAVVLQKIDFNHPDLKQIGETIKSELGFDVDTLQGQREFGEYLSEKLAREKSQNVAASKNPCFINVISPYEFEDVVVEFLKENYPNTVKVSANDFWDILKEVCHLDASHDKLKDKHFQHFIGEGGRCTVANLIKTHDVAHAVGGQYCHVPGGLAEQWKDYSQSGDVKFIAITSSLDEILKRVESNPRIDKDVALEMTSISAETALIALTNKHLKKADLIYYNPEDKKTEIIASKKSERFKVLNIFLYGEAFVKRAKLPSLLNPLSRENTKDLISNPKNPVRGYMQQEIDVRNNQRNHYEQDTQKALSKELGGQPQPFQLHRGNLPQLQKKQTSSLSR